MREKRGEIRATEPTALVQIVGHFVVGRFTVGIVGSVRRVGRVLSVVLKALLEESCQTNA